MKKGTIWTIVVVVVLVAAGIVLLNLPKAEAPEGAIPEEQAAGEETETVAPAEVEPGIVPEAKVDEALKGVEVVPVASGGATREQVADERAGGVTIKLNVSTTGFTPKEFEVKAGETVTLSITSTDKTHVFKFDDPELQNVALGLAGGETRAISFKAPARKGDYTFFCDVPGHRAGGETGLMRVK